MSISVCILAKNEEKYIKNCLESIKDIADEILILDTGSSDKTVEISLQYGKIYYYKWENDFSKARNYLINLAKKEWIFFIDADEILKTPPYIIKKYLENIDLDIINFKIINNNDKLLKSIFYRACIFRNNLGLKYKYPVHEQLEINNKNKIISKSDFIIETIEEDLSPEEKKNKLIGYRQIINNYLSENSSNNDLVYYYPYLGDIESIFLNYEIALNLYIESYNLHDKNNLLSYSNLLYKIIQNMIFHQSLYNEATPFIAELLGICPDYPDALFFLAYTNQKLRNYIPTLGLYKKILKIISKKEKEYFTISIFDNKLENIIKVEMARIYYIIGEKDKALSLFDEIYNIDNSLSDILFQLIRINLINNNIEACIPLFKVENSAFKLKGIEELEKISKLPKDSIAFISLQLKLLYSINSFKGWQIEEKMEIEDKIEYLNFII